MINILRILITKKQEILQNSEVAGRALRSISLRLHGYSEDSEDGLLETDEELKTISGDLIDLTKTAEHTQGISIFEAGSTEDYKSLVDYFVELNSIWDEMSEKQQNDYLQKAFGKTQAQAGASLITNAKAIKEAMNTMDESAGSSEAEMEKIRQSVSFKINELQQTWVGFAQELLSREDIGEIVDKLIDGSNSLEKVVVSLTPAVKIFIDLLGGFIDILSKILDLQPGLLTFSEVLGGIFLLSSKNGFSDKRFISVFNSIKDAFTGLNDKALSIDRVSEALKEMSSIELKDWNFFNDGSFKIEGQNEIVSQFKEILDELSDAEQESVLEQFDLGDKLSEAINAEVEAKELLSVADTKEMISSMALTSEKEAEISATLQQCLVNGEWDVVKLQELALREDEIGLIAQSILAKEGETAANVTATASVKAFTLAIWDNVKAMAAWLISNPVGWIILAGGAIAGIIGLVDLLTTSLEEQQEKTKELQSELDDIQGQLDDINTELETTVSRIEELEGKESLSFVEEQELENLKEQNIELERRNKLIEAQRDAKQKEVAASVKEEFDKEFKDVKYISNSVNDYQKELDSLLYKRDNQGVINSEGIEITFTDEDLARLNELEALTQEVGEHIGEITIEESIKEQTEAYTELDNKIKEMEADYAEKSKTMSQEERKQFDDDIQELKDERTELNKELTDKAVKFDDYVDRYGVDDEVSQSWHNLSVMISDCLDPAASLEQRFNKAWNSFTETAQNSIIKLAQKGELSVNTLTKGATAYFERMGVDASEAVEQIYSTMTDNDAALSAIRKLNDEYEKAKKRREYKVGGLEYVGNVDINNRPVVVNYDGSYSTTQTAFQEIYDDKTGTYQIIHYTPILPDGTVLSENELANYIDNVLSGADNILEADADNYGIVYKVDTEVNGEAITDSNLNTAFDQADTWDISMHEKQDAIYKKEAEALLKLRKAQEDYHKSISNTDISYSEAMNNVGTYTDKLDTLMKVYDDVKDKEDFDYSSIVNNDDFAEAFGNLSSYESFIETVTSSPKDIKKCQDAFDQLATEALYSSDCFEGLSESSKEATIQFLKQKGISNAAEIVEHQLKLLADEEQYIAESGTSIKNSSVEKINSFLSLSDAADTVKQSISELYLQELNLNTLTINTETDCNNIANIAAAAGASTEYVNELREALIRLMNARDTKLESDTKKTPVSDVVLTGTKNPKVPSGIQGIFDAVNDAAEKAVEEELKDSQINVEEIIAKIKANVLSQTKTTGTSNNSSDSGSDSKETFDWLEQRITRLQSEISELDEAASNVYSSFSDRNTALGKEISTITSEIKAQTKAYSTYKAKANSVGLSDDLKKKVRKGSIKGSYKDLIKEYGEDTAKKITEYKEWYDKALEAKNAINNLEEDKLSKDLEINDDNIQEVQYKLDELADTYDEVSSRISNASKKTDVNDFAIIDSNLTNQAAQYNAQLAEQKAKLDKLTPGTQAYLDVEKEIRETTKSLADLEDKRLDNNIAKIDYYLQQNQNYLDLLGDQADDIQTRLSNSKKVRSGADYDALGANYSEQIATYTKRLEIARQKLSEYDEESQDYVDTQKEIRSLTKTIADLTDKRLDNEIAKTQSLIDITQNYIGYMNSQYNAGQAYLNYIKSMSKDEIGVSSANYESLNAVLSRQIDSYKSVISYNQELLKKVDEGSDDWYKYQDAITSAESSLLSIKQSMIETAKAAAQVGDSIRDSITSSIDDVISLTDAMIENQTNVADKNALIEQKIVAVDKKSVSYNNAVAYNENNLKNASAKITANSPTEEIQNLVNSGEKIPSNLLESVSESGNTALYEACIEYNQYLLAVETSKKARRLYQEQSKTEKANLRKEQFTNISSAYGDITKEQQHSIDMLDAYISLANAKGSKAITDYYVAQQEIQQDKLKVTEAKVDHLKKNLQDALDSGLVEEGSAAWREMQDEIEEAEKDVIDCNTSLADTVEKLREIKKEKFDLTTNYIDDLKSEADFLKGLLNEDKFYDKESGAFTDQGVAARTLTAVDYSVNMAQAKRLEAEIARKTEKELINDDGSTNSKVAEEIFQMAQEVRSYYSDANSNLKEIESMIKSSLDKLKEALSKNISKFTEALDAQQEQRDYQQTITDKNTTLKNLQAQYTALSGDSSEENRAVLQNLQSQITDAQKDLDDTLYAQYVKDQKQMLNDLQTNLEDFITTLDTETLAKETIAAIDLDTTTTRDVISEIANTWGYSASNSLTGIFGKDKTWSDGINNAIGDQTTVVDNIYGKGDDNITENVSKIKENLSNTLTSLGYNSSNGALNEDMSSLQTKIDGTTGSVDGVEKEVSKDATEISKGLGDISTDFSEYLGDESTISKNITSIDSTISNIYQLMKATADEEAKKAAEEAARKAAEAKAAADAEAARIAKEKEDAEAAKKAAEAAENAKKSAIRTTLMSDKDYFAKGSSTFDSNNKKTDNRKYVVKSVAEALSSLGYYSGSTNIDWFTEDFEDAITNYRNDKGYDINHLYPDISADLIETLLKDFDGYYTGGKNIADDLIVTQEKGGEYVIRKDGAVLTPMGSGAGRGFVLNNAQSEFLYDFTKSMTSGNIVDPSSISTKEGFGQSYVLEVGGIVMNEVNDPETFAKNFKNAINNNTSVRKTLLSTVDSSMTGKNSLNSRRF